MSWKKDPKCSICMKSLFLSNVVNKCVYIPVSEHFSFAKIIHPHNRCSVSRSWFNSMIITQVHLVLGTIKALSKMCSFVTQHNVTDVSRFEGVSIDMLTSGISTRAVARSYNVDFSTINCLQRRFREFLEYIQPVSQPQTTCTAWCGWAVCWCQRCEHTATGWRWGYGIGRNKLRITNTIALYQWQFQCTEIPWQDLEAVQDVQWRCVIQSRGGSYFGINTRHISVCKQCKKQN